MQNCFYRSIINGSMKFKKRGIKLFMIPILIATFISRNISRKKTTITLGMLMSIFVLWFHRNPNREAEGKNGYTSPFDGRVEKIEDRGDEVFFSVYLGLKDVHSIRSHTSGTISDINRTNGYNFPALITELSEKNNSLSFNYEEGDSLTIYTGVLARRLINETREEKRVERGEEIGFISFGSRGTITINKQNFSTIRISEGDKIRSGETIIAE